MDSVSPLSFSVDYSMIYSFILDSCAALSQLTIYDRSRILQLSNPFYLGILPYYLRDTESFNFSPTTAWNIGSGVRTEFKSTLFEYTNMYLSVIFRIAERSTWRGMVMSSFFIKFKTYQFSLVLVKQVLLMPYSDS